MGLKADFSAELPAWRKRVEKLVKESGDVIVDQVNF